ncbi:hypothetical protein BpHYR1_007048 [Brachionus plicatilis]|uniref:Uncharacterized protein n=1 Tax=Brachionus plicatilis TaxID=10195 RepID=A0A3M7S7U7_BRAPC|nr:hypothetical protein BpHYR1_007048 [Brachionus plicatilis]
MAMTEAAIAIEKSTIAAVLAFLHVEEIFVPNDDFGARQIKTKAVDFEIKNQPINNRNKYCSRVPNNREFVSN